MSAHRILRSNTKALSSSLKPQLASNHDDLNTIGKSSKRLANGKKDGEPAMPLQSFMTSPRKKVKLVSTSTPSEIDLGQGNNMRAQYTNVTLDRPIEPQMNIEPPDNLSDSQPALDSKEVIDFCEPTSNTPRATGNLLEQACHHLIRVDSRLKPLIEKYPCPLFSTDGLAEVVDPFQSLCNGILSQQVSGPAAKSIRNRFVALFKTMSAGVDPPGLEKYPLPVDVAACDISFLRQAGLSQRKAEYIKGLAEKFASGELSAATLLKASDKEVMEQLTAVRGLGKWSVEMFACFGLKRMDVLSTGDLGVQRGIAAFMGKDVKKIKSKGGGKWKYMSEKEMQDISANYSPYRSLFMWYMWRVEDVNIETFENI